MLVLTVNEAYNLSGVYDTDSDFEKDCKLSAWIGRRKYRCIEYNVVTHPEESDQARVDGIEVLIIKETKNVTKS